jgi:hypothetical protein
MFINCVSSNKYTFTTFIYTFIRTLIYTLYTIHSIQGVNGRWRDTLSAQEVQAYDARAEKELGADCARWFATGEGL